MNRIHKLLNTTYVLGRSRVERTIPFWPIEWIERLQRHRLRGMIRHAYRTVPFYRQAIDERGLQPTDFRTVDDLSRLPLIDGMAVQRNISSFLSTGYGEDSRWAFYSGGSTSGVRRAVYWDKASILGKRATTGRDQVVLENLLGQRRYIHIHIPPAGSSRFTMQAFSQASTFMPQSAVQDLVLSPEERLEIIAERINAVRPQVVSSYASFAERFFRFLANRQMSITVPRIWIYGSEMLSPSAKELIENTFGCPTYSTYQATETGRLGFQCEERQGFHLNIDLCAMRLVDEDGQTVKPGELGEVVISNLYNRAMVLLNYRLDDWGVMGSGLCSCGRSLPLLERLEGRTSEMLHLASGRMISSLTLEISCQDELKPTLQIQIVQPAPGQIRWRLVPSSSVDPETLRRNLFERCRVVLGDDTQVEIELVEEIPAPRDGKFPRVVSHVTPSDARDSTVLGRAELKDQGLEK
jgi:phenylacetate-CoA ligase